MSGGGPSGAEVETAIADELIRVHEESYGTGASRIEVLVEDNMVIAVIDVDLTPAEQTLLDAGQIEAVKLTRESFQEAIEPTFTAIVEHVTGRKVAAFLSAMSVEPVYSIEFFRLAPET